jgi:hypothetical protein
VIAFTNAAPIPCEAPVMTATFLSMLIKVLHLPC